MKHVRINRLSLTAFLATVVCLLLLIPCGSVQGFTLQVTENPLSTTNQLNGAYHPGFLQNDPGPGGLPNALTYTTPGGLVVGDLLLHEPGTGESDLVRWNNNATLVFYSDIGDGDSADIGLPGASWPNAISLIETGLVLEPFPMMVPYSENGMNGYIYVPLPGQPGYDMNNPGNQPTYIIISDVPEPSTVVLVGLSLAGLLSVIRRRK
jgi:hypothetical protein